MNPEDGKQLVKDVIYLLVQEERGKWIPFNDILSKLSSFSSSYTTTEPEEILNILMTESTEYGESSIMAVQILEWNGVIYGFRIIPMWWDFLNLVQKGLNLIVGLKFGIQVEKSS